MAWSVSRSDFRKKDRQRQGGERNVKGMSGPAKILFSALTIALSLSARAELPALIPREILFGNPARSDPQVSPDGTQIAWLAPDKNEVLNVWASAIGGDNPHLITNEAHRPIGWYAWGGDGKHVLYLQDIGGDENQHLFSADLTNGNVRDLTPFRGVRAQNVMTDFQHPRFALVGLNLRDRRVFDMYRIDLETGAVTLEAQNPGDVITWTADNDFVIRGATAFEGKTCASIVRIRDAADKPWRDLVVMPFERALFAGEVYIGSLIAGFDPDGKSLIIHSALHSDKGRLVRVDLRTGEEVGVVAQDPQSDVAEYDDYLAPHILTNPSTGAIEAVLFDYTTPHWVFLDPKLEADFAEIGREVSGFIEVICRDQVDRKWIIAARRSDRPASYYTFDRETKKVAFLYDEHPAMKSYRLAAKKPVIIKARDGLELVCYLTTPPGVAAKDLPLIVRIHGGPWDRDNDSYDAEVQFLANRGYAVLEVNYRGSTGFGLKYFNAGNGEYGLGMVEDLFDATQWAIGQGIADRKRIGAMGASGGGFATLRAVEMRPDLFTCGVDIVGPSNLAENFRAFPSYWSIVMPRWRRRGGDYDHDEALNRKVSPIFHIDQIRAPLLIAQGQNDARVAIATVDAMVAALRKAKREVDYVVYPDEGHGFYRPENQFDFYGRAEEFLAKHLSGRAEPWKKIDGSTAEVR
jgi:dipeptidyl aminopeptidase/acylaminoacyl peptidase